MTYLAKAKGLPVSIHVGIHDGHTGAVPVSHSLWAFNVLAKANGKKSAVFTDAQIEEMVEKERVPAGLGLAKPEPEGKFPALLRRTAGAARITVFEGGHATDFATAVAWLAGFVR